MSKSPTLVTILTLTLSSVCLQTNFALARNSHLLLIPGNMADAINAPAETITQTSSPTVTNTITGTKPMMESFANAQGYAHGRLNYFIDAPVKHTAPISSIDKRSNINIGKFGALRNPATTGGNAPQGPTGTIYGNGNSKSGTVPGFGYGKSSFGKGVNLPGANTNGNSVNGVPGFENVGNGPQINLPGGRQKKGSPADAQKLLAAQESADVAKMLDKAAQGPSVNVPSQSNPGQAQADGLLDSIVSFFSGGSSDANAKSGEKTAPATSTNANGESKGQKGAQAEQHTVLTSESLNGEFKDSNGNITVSQGYQMRDAFTGEVVSGSLVTIGPITITKSKYMPGDDTTGGPVDTSAGLAVGNSLNHKSDGGGTDNNDTSTSGGSGELDPGAPVNKLGNADGQGDDAGENNGNHVDDGAMASSALAKRQQVDGNDGRGARSAAQAKAN